MTTPSKAKGNGYERELVEQFGLAGCLTKRAWGSNGQSLGLHEEVDVLVEFKNKAGVTDYLELQAKRRKTLPGWIALTEHVDASVVRANNDKSYIFFRLEDFIKRFIQ